MSAKQAILDIEKTFDINRIYAKKVFLLADKTNLLDDAARIIGEKPKPFVKWVGGKRQLLLQFRRMNLYPPEKFDSKKAKYFEPFVGGGAVFFDMLPNNACLSDLNKELITTYNVIKNDVEKLICALLEHKNDKEYFLMIRAKNPKKLDDISVASRFIFLNRTCFNGLYRVNQSGGFNVPFANNNNPLICDAENLRKVAKVLQGVEIQNEDYKEVLKKAKKGDFVYFDPPYYPTSRTASFTSYTSEAFLEKEQIELRDTVVKLHKRGCFVMLSNSDTPFINEMYFKIKGLRITKVQAGRAINSVASKRGKITEVLVTNY